VGIGVAWGDRIGRLIQILETDPSYKVRLQAAIALGNLKNKRAVPALIHSLSDENFTIRGVSAAALGQIGDKRALPELQQLVKKEKNSFVLAQAERATKVLVGQAEGPPPGARFFLTIGKLSNKANSGGNVLAIFLGEALVKEFAKVPGVATEWGGRNPTANELSRRQMKGFILDGAILSLTVKRLGESTELSCNIRVSLATYPGNSMKAFYTGGASTEVSTRSFKPEQEEGLFRDVLEGAAQGAREHIVQSYLSMQ